MKLIKWIGVLALFVPGVASSFAKPNDIYFQAYVEVRDSAPSNEHELMALISNSEALSDSNPVASVYVALLRSMVEHPTGYEKYAVVTESQLQKVKDSHPSLFFRHQILVAYNLANQDKWRSALNEINEVISFADGIDEELYLDAVAAKSSFLARMGLLRASLNTSAKILERLPSLMEKRFFGDGAIENIELQIGLSISYLGEYKRALELCARAQHFFLMRPLGSPHRYYQSAIDCQRRSLEGLGKNAEASKMLDVYLEYALSISDWDSYVYGLDLKIQHLYTKNEIEEVIELIQQTEVFVSGLPVSYDTTAYQVSRFKALVGQGKYKSAEKLSDEIVERLQIISGGDLLWAQFKSAQASLFEKTGNLIGAISALRDSKNHFQSLYYQTDDRKELFSDYYESALAERRLELLKREHELAERDLWNSNRLNLLLTVGAVILIFCLTIMFYLYLVQRRLKKEHEELASVDLLTGIHNRRSALQAIQREIDKANRCEHPISLVLIDLDKFKAVNDNFGHECGDNLLKTFAEHVSNSIRKIDIFGRYGGEEFIVCLPLTTAVDAQKVMNSILEGYGEVTIEPAITQPSFSAGVTEYKDGVETSLLIRQCDEALYEAKRLGRNRVCIFS